MSSENRPHPLTLGTATQIGLSNCIGHFNFIFIIWSHCQVKVVLISVLHTSRCHTNWGNTLFVEGVASFKLHRTSFIVSIFCVPFFCLNLFRIVSSFWGMHARAIFYFLFLVWVPKYITAIWHFISLLRFSLIQMTKSFHFPFYSFNSVQCTFS